MNVSSRKAANKAKSSKEFRGNTNRTKAVNVAPPPQRGGFRL